MNIENIKRCFLSKDKRNLKTLYYITCYNIDGNDNTDKTAIFNYIYLEFTIRASCLMNLIHLFPLKVAKPIKGKHKLKKIISTINKEIQLMESLIEEMNKFITNYNVFSNGASINGMELTKVHKSETNKIVTTITNTYPYEGNQKYNFIIIRSAKLVILSFEEVLTVLTELTKFKEIIKDIYNQFLNKYKVM